MSDFLHSFGVNKVEKLKRTKYMFPIRNTCEQAQGVLVPLAWHLVTPSELWSCRAQSFNRLLLNLAKPVYGDIYFSYTAHFVPLRILFKDYEKMFGDGSPQEWVNWTEYIIPTVTFDYQNASRSTVTAGTGYDAVMKSSSDGTSINSSGHIISKPGNLANYCWLPPTRAANGVPTGSKEINPAPLLAYLRIWSDFYRDENWQEEDPDLAKYKAFNSGTSGGRTNLRFSVHYANRFHDYFSSLLPDTQKGPDVLAFSHLVTLNDLYTLEMEGQSAANPIKFGDQSKNLFTNSSLAITGAGKLVAPSSSSVSSTAEVKSTNLGVEISTDALRSAFALKRARERNARTGSRFTEAMLSVYEAHLPQAVAQKAEYLGGNSFRLNITSVPSTTYQHAGDLGAFSATKDDSEVFRKTFNEPGILMIVGTYRIKHRYAQGIPLAFMKTRRYHSYDPAFAHISEQPHYAWELSPINDDGVDVVIGFNEPWVEDLKPVDHVCGLMGDVYGSAWNTYKQWTFVDEFDPGDSISPAAWLPEWGNEVAKRCTDYNASFPSWVFGTDFQAECSVVSPRPLYSIPGYIDHTIA